MMAPVYKQFHLIRSRYGNLLYFEAFLKTDKCLTSSPTLPLTKSNLIASMRTLW